MGIPKKNKKLSICKIIFNLRYQYQKIAIIPIIKDEGGDSSNNDRINGITFSWMSLLNIYKIRRGDD